MRNRSLRLVVSSLALCALSIAGQAAPVVYSGADNGANSSDPRPLSTAAAASFDAAAGALGPITVIDFESSPLGAFSALNPVSWVTITGDDISGGDQTVVNSPVGSPDGVFGYNTTSGGSQFVSLFGGNLLFSFSDPIQAFGAYFSGLQGDLVGQQTITFSDGSSQTVDIPMLTGGIAFVGFTDAGKSIASVQVDILGDIVGVDDVRLVKTHDQPGQEVPEPGTMAFLVGSLTMGALAGARRMRRA